MGFQVCGILFGSSLCPLLLQQVRRASCVGQLGSVHEALDDGCQALGCSGLSPSLRVTASGPLLPPFLVFPEDETTAGVAYF